MCHFVISMQPCCLLSNIFVTFVARALWMMHTAGIYVHPMNAIRVKCRLAG